MNHIDVVFSKKVAVVVPAFNEGSVIGGVVDDVRRTYSRVIVVDDCSTDDTAAQAASHGAIVLRHAINLGQGASLQTGISYALKLGADLIVTFDADGQHRVEDIAVLIEEQRRSDSDVVTGSRFLGNVVNMPPIRRVVLKAAVVFTRLTTGLQVTDAHNGLRVFTRDAAGRIYIRQNRMAHASELVNQFSELGLKVTEAPMTVSYTRYSLAKGQKLSNSISILFELFLARILK